MPDAHATAPDPRTPNQERKIRVQCEINGHAMTLETYPMARLLDVYARRLQTQEHLNSQVAIAIDEILKPRGVAVMIEAEHMCMSLRGVEKPGALTVTTHFTGAFRDDPNEQVRFMTMLRAGQR